MSSKKNRRPAGKRKSGDPRRQGLATYSEARASRHLLAFVGQNHWNEMEQNTIGLHNEEDRRAIMLLILLLGATVPPQKDVVSFRSELLDTFVPLSSGELAQARSRLVRAHGVVMTTDGQSEIWRLPFKVRMLVAAFPMALLRRAWKAMATDCDAALAMLTMAAEGRDGQATVTVSYADLTAAANRSVSEVLDLERFLVETGALVWAMPTGEGMTRWRLASPVLA